MPEPGSMTGNLAKAVERVAAAGQQVRQNARDAAARNAPQTAQDGPGRPEGPGVAVSPTQPNGGRQ